MGIPIDSYTISRMHKLNEQKLGRDVIALRLGVSVASVHKYLGRAERITKRWKYFLQSPEGVQYETTKIYSFAKEHGLHAPSLCRMCIPDYNSVYNCKQHKGWTSYKVAENY